jgi:carbonic anhydrase
MVNRRSFLSGLLACPVCAAEAFAQEWNYRESGPERWASLDRAFSPCGTGDQQSPIDLRDGIKADLPRLRVQLPRDRVTVLNNGHTIQVSSPAGASVAIGGVTFPLSQFHFHSPSEHSIEGRPAAMEVHFVYAHKDGLLTVLGALLVSGRRNPAFAKIMAVAPERRDGKAQAATLLDARKLLPDRLDQTWRYEGSLTTPPCSQTVDWIVFNDRVEVAEEDIGRFRRIFPNNARPRQPLNRRVLLTG